MSSKNTGFDLARQKAEETIEDWKFGAVVVKGVADLVAGLVIALYAWPPPKDGIYNRVEYAFNHVVIFFNKLFGKYYPKGELQFGQEDFMDCVTRGHNNEIEKQINYLIDEKKILYENLAWLIQKGYINDIGDIELSDRFSAMLSNTTRSGNSLKAPIDAIYRYGCIPKKMLPKKEGMTFDEYHNKLDITAEMMKLGEEWKQHFTINYVTVAQADFNNFCGPVRYEIFDNYLDAVDGDYIKLLATDYRMYPNGYQIIINEIPQKKSEEEGDTMTFFKNPGDSKIYMFGADKFYHWVIDEPVFMGLFGDFSQHTIKEQVIPPQMIGFTVYDKRSFVNVLFSFLNNLKGK
jgi:hypothetical protein